MHRDILIKADPVYDFLNNLHNPQEYIFYTDLIIPRIRKDKNPQLKEA